jgi:SPFH domain / Band 7 family
MHGGRSTVDVTVIREARKSAASGFLVLVVLLALTVIDIVAFVQGAKEQAAPLLLGGYAVVAVLLVIAWLGLFIVNPNEAKVLQLFGSYVGTVHESGLKYANSFLTKRKVRVRVRNFETGKLKVNDQNSNPIEIAAIVVWRVVDTAEALFEVDDYNEYVHVQSASALRGLATNYPYDAHTEGEMSLAANAVEISDKLTSETRRDSRRRASRSWNHASATLPTRPRSPARCSSGSRRAPSLRLARRSSKEPWAWWRWPSPTWRNGTSSAWMTTAKHRWSAACWRCCARTGTRSPS